MERKICFITGTRADYGIMSGLMQRLRDTPGVRLQVIATGTHLSDRHGMTVDEILADGLPVDARVPMPGADGSPRKTVEAMGVTLAVSPAIFDDLDMVEYLYDLQTSQSGNDAGAFAIVVGTAITHPTSITSWFANAIS